MVMQVRVIRNADNVLKHGKRKTSFPGVIDIGDMNYKVRRIRGIGVEEKGTRTLRSPLHFHFGFTENRIEVFKRHSKSKLSREI